MHTNATPSLVAVFGFLVALTLGASPVTSTLSPTHSGVHALVHTNLAQKLAQLEVFGNLVKDYEVLVNKARANPDSYKDTALTLQMVAKAHQVEIQAWRLELIFGCPEGDALFYGACDDLPAIREQWGILRSFGLSFLVSYLGRATHQSDSIKALSTM